MKTFLFFCGYLKGLWKFFWVAIIMVNSNPSGVIYMDAKVNMNEASEELKEAFVSDNRIKSTSAKSGQDAVVNRARKKSSRAVLVMMASGAVGLVAGICLIIYSLLGFNNEAEEMQFANLKGEEVDNNIYSVLTGEKLAEGEERNAPIYCMQTPNGTDGARPQSGLKEAGVIFEAVAEAGITRFAAIYQNPKSAVIGPIRSLRSYYLQWDTPFDCTIVHAGGSGDALAAVSSGGYKDLSEDYSYMYRGTYKSRLWNNLFTTSTMLKQFGAERSYNSDNAKGLNRMTPDESKKARVDALAAEKLNIVHPASGNTSELGSTVNTIALRFGGIASFNVKYTYDGEHNQYLRSYENGTSHEVYECESSDLGQKNPEDVCTLGQMSPAVVIAMIVQESRAADNYHENITTVGSGDAYIFQNGTAIKGTWKKDAVDEQIKFVDAEGGEIKLAPGQTMISAVPQYGSVAYDVAE